jgi:FkbM family methyltransferase
LVGSCGRVIAFEPVPAICKRLKHNIALNGLQNVECISAALDAQDGTMLMTTLPKSALSTAHLRFNLEAPGMQVETITLAHACVEHNIDRIHLLKIDCEGSEYGIFETMPRDLAVRIDQIAMEVHEVEDHSADDLVILLETLGFSVTRKGCNWFAVQTRNSGSADIAIRRYVTPLGALAHKP